MSNFISFMLEAQNVVNRFDLFLKKHAVAGRVRPDHICYKCGSRATFEYIRSSFEELGCSFWSAHISGRSICYIVLPGNGLISSFGLIKYLELADQKPDGSQADSFDHIEVYPLGWSYEEMVAELAKTEKVVEVVRPHHTTHDITIGNGLIFRATREPLIEKIVREEIIVRPAL